MKKELKAINLEKRLKLLASLEGLIYRNLGTMESNVNRFASRMKGKKSWSEKGATNLLRVAVKPMVEKPFKDYLTIGILQS
jgi:hypothetical protein